MSGFQVLLELDYMTTLGSHGPLLGPMLAAGWGLFSHIPALVPLPRTSERNVIKATVCEDSLPELSPLTGYRCP